MDGLLGPRGQLVYAAAAGLAARQVRLAVQGSLAPPLPAVAEPLNLELAYFPIGARTPADWLCWIVGGVLAHALVAGAGWLRARCSTAPVLEFSCASGRSELIDSSRHSATPCCGSSWAALPGRPRFRGRDAVRNFVDASVRRAMSDAGTGTACVVVNY